MTRTLGLVEDRNIEYRINTSLGIIYSFNSMKSFITFRRCLLNLCLAFFGVI